MEQSLFERLGGAPALDLVVDKFYEFMLVDPTVNHYFKNTDMVKQHKRQKQFLTMAFGGPNEYEGVDMKKAHAKFPIRKVEFDATWTNLLKALKHFKVSEELISEVKEVFDSV